MLSAAIEYAQADVADPCSNFVHQSRVRAGRGEWLTTHARKASVLTCGPTRLLVLGRCHAALGQHALSASALGAALEQAKAHGLRWSESLAAQAKAGVEREWADRRAGGAS